MIVIENKSTTQLDTLVFRDHYCDEDGNEQESAPHPKQILWVDLGADVDKYDILRKKEDN